MDLSKLTTSDWLIGGGTLAYLVFMFLNWHSKSEAGFTLSQSGWDYFLTGIIPLVLLLAAAVVSLLPKLQPSVSIPENFGPLTRAQAVLAACGAAAVLVLLRLIVPAEIEFLGQDTGENFDRKFGLFLALLAAGAAAAGAFMKYSSNEDVGIGPGGPSGGPPTPF